MSAGARRELAATLKANDRLPLFFANPSIAELPSSPRLQEGRSL
jgi:hypothetical protein